MCVCVCVCVRPCVYIQRSLNWFKKICYTCIYKDIVSIIYILYTFIIIPHRKLNSSKIVL